MHKKAIFLVLATANTIFGEAISSEQNQLLGSTPKAVETSPKSSPQPFESGMPIQENQFPAGYNHSARIESGDCWDCTFRVAFNEYYAVQDGMAIAATSFLDSARQTGSVVNLDFNYHPGFELGMNVNTPFDHWVLEGKYLWFRSHSNVSKSVTADLSLTSPFVIALGASYVSISANWNLGIDFADLVAARPYYSGTRWTVEPFVGLRGGVIRQYVHFSGTQLDPELPIVQSSVKSHSWLVGPCGGIDTNLLLGAGFSLTANLSTSLLYTRYTTLSVKSSETSGALAYQSDNGISTVTPNFDTGLGIKWGSYFSSQKYFFDLSAVYNFRAFFSQNQLMALIASSNTGVGFSAGNLYLHGVSIATSFTF
jgi:hypothetical protein